MFIFVHMIYDVNIYSNQTYYPTPTNKSYGIYIYHHLYIYELNSQNYYWYLDSIIYNLFRSSKVANIKSFVWLVDWNLLYQLTWFVCSLKTENGSMIFHVEG